MFELASLTRFANFCARYFPVHSDRQFLLGRVAAGVKTPRRSLMLLAACALVGTCALCGVIFAQQSSSKNPAAASAAKGSPTSTLAAGSESQPMALESRLPASVRFYVHW